MQWKSLLAAIVVVTCAVAAGVLSGRLGTSRAATVPPPTRIGAPTISGTPQEGQTLTTSNGTWSGVVNGYTYAWKRCNAVGDDCVPIAGASERTYRIVGSDIGHTLRVTVTASNDGGSTSATSVPTAIVAGTAAPKNIGTPTISGTPQEGQTLTTTNGTWSGAVSGYGYAWKRCNASGDNCAPIAGATKQTYKVASTDVGQTLRVTVTAKNSTGSTSATSVPTAVVSSTSAPKNTAPPTISGTAQVGQTLTASRGAWSGVVTGYTFAWKRCDTHGNSCSAISGATNATYGLTQADAGTTLRVAVTASNQAGATSATSVPTATVPQPVSTGCPSGTGTIQVADLTAPARLAVDFGASAPARVSRSTTSLELRFHVTACDGRPVQGASVFAVPIPYNQFRGTTGTTDANGMVTLTEPRLAGFPANSRQGLLAVLVRATKPGQPFRGNVSTRRAVSYRVAR